MKRRIMLLIIVALQGIGAAKTERTQSTARAVLEEMKAKDEVGMFQRRTFSTTSYPRLQKQTSPLRTAGEVVQLRETQPNTSQVAQQGVQQNLPPEIMEKLYPPMGFRELHGYEKYLALQGIRETTPYSYSPQVIVSRSFIGPTQQPFEASRLEKGKGFSFSNGPVRTLSFRDISEVPKGGITLKTSRGQFFLKYGVICSLHDGVGLAIKNGEKVEIWEAKVVDLP